MKIHCDSRDDFVYSIRKEDGEVWPYPRDIDITEEKIEEINRINNEYEKSQEFLQNLFRNGEQNKFIIKVTRQQL